jgi:hypothetical protein
MIICFQLDFVSTFLFFVLFYFYFNFVFVLSAFLFLCSIFASLVVVVSLPFSNTQSK